MIETINQIPRKVRADFHNHLITSSRIKDRHFNRAVDIAAERLGNGGTFGMVNFDDKRYEKFSGLKGYDRAYIGENRNAIYIPERDVLIVKGQEVPTKDGHLFVLGLGYDQHIQQHQTLEDTIKEAKDFSATIILDHAFFIPAGGAGLYINKNYKLLKDIDAIEIYNGESVIYPFSNLRAQLLLNKMVTFSLGTIATSDGHSFYELGRSWTEIDEIDREKPGNFLPSLKMSVQNTRDAEKGKNSITGFIGVADHTLDLKLWIPMFSKIGFGWYFQTERPEGNELR